MRYVHLGRTGLRVSRLRLGTMNFAWQIGEPDSHAVLDRALGAGITFVDTADMYGRRTGDGLSERFIGSWFERSGARDKIVLATNVYAGSSNFAGWHLARARAAADRRHYPGLVSEQPRYNLLTRHVQLELLSRPGVTAPVLGPRTPDQLDLPLLAPDTELSAATLAELDRIFPPVGTGGPGPEAWAW
jgi:aryl-alcohol dehydrogenase-like predicted oxidoreductase